MSEDKDRFYFVISNQDFTSFLGFETVSGRNDIELNPIQVTDVCDAQMWMLRETVDYVFNHYENHAFLIEHGLTFITRIEIRPRHTAPLQQDRNQQEN
jgi:hypothetical protein